jgi:pullulanase/glycogen debranching enzyme
MPFPPSGRYGLLRIPGPPPIAAIAMRLAPLTDRDVFDPTTWPVHPLTPTPGLAGWWDFDVDAAGLADGAYEYEFVVDGDANNPVADPYADEITRFGGYRGVLHVAGGTRVAPTFRWDADVEAGTTFPPNNQIVVYEMPLRWMTNDAPEDAVVDLGTFEMTVFEHLDDLKALGVNCIELRPIEDSPQTLNWGYGTRFFFAPDFDMGQPVDARFFIKSCHERGIRVLLDVVMAFFADECALGTLAPSWFAASLAGQFWGGTQFLYYSASLPAGFVYPAPEFLCTMAEFWVTEYHVDGFRIDDFADINNWDFVQEFHDRATAASNAAFPNKPFLVVAEDSGRHFVATGPDPGNPGGRKVTDAIWNFGFQDEIRRLATGTLTTVLGQPSRTERVEHFLSKDGVWDGGGGFAVGYADLACAVNYATSHDVQNDPRMMNVILDAILIERGLAQNEGSNTKAAVQDVRKAVDSSTDPNVRTAVSDALGRVFGVFALVTTSVGIPMFLAGEEFADVHDRNYGSSNSNRKQEDPVQWQRASYPGNQALRSRVAALVQLRTTHPALQRNEVAFFYFHPTFDDDGGTYVFAYCRTAGKPLGSPGQVIVVANMCDQVFASFTFPGWPWGGSALTEIGAAATSAPASYPSGGFAMDLTAFQVRVFQS